MKNNNSTTSCGRQVPYSKRRDVIQKKASELSVLCGIDVALILFSPKGKLTSFATNGRIEDIFLRYIDQSNDARGSCSSTNRANLYQALKQLKWEREMLGKLERIETLEGKMQQLKQQQQEKQDRLKCYNYEMQKVSSISEALLHEQFLTNAIHNVEQLKAQLLSSRQIVSPRQNLESVQMAVDEEDVEEFEDLLTWGESVDSEKDRNEVMKGKQGGGGGITGPHLSLEFLAKQKRWNLKTNSNNANGRQQQQQEFGLISSVGNFPCL